MRWYHLNWVSYGLLSVLATISQAALSADDVDQAQDYGIAFIVVGTADALKTFEGELGADALAESDCNVKKNVELKKVTGLDVKLPKKTFGSHPDVYSCAKTSTPTFSAFGNALIATLGKGDFVFLALVGCPKSGGTQCAKYCSADGDLTCYKERACLTVCRR